jgi:hypothetical protein
LGVVVRQRPEVIDLQIPVIKEVDVVMLVGSLQAQARLGRQETLRLIRLALIGHRAYRAYRVGQGRGADVGAVLAAVNRAAAAAPPQVALRAVRIERESRI